MISLRRPDLAFVEEYASAQSIAEPTCPPASVPPPGFHRDVVRHRIGSGAEALDRGRAGLREWAAHRGSGVEIHPASVELVPGATVALLTRQLGLWVLAACRVVSVTDEPDRFGFTYATLPDHPETGYESFMVADHGDEVVFTIEAVSRPAAAVVQLGLPVTRHLQRRAIHAYGDALGRFVDGS